jgi:hypothetical protein
MTSMPKITGGGINSRQTSHYTDGKKEPVVNPVSIGATSRIGSALAVGTVHKNLYSSKSSTPFGATPNNDCRPGGNGRMILKAGSQSPTPAPTPMSGPRRSLFK